MYLNKIDNQNTIWQLPPILLEHWGFENTGIEFNHEIWWTCPHCSEVYDARWHQKTCPVCKHEIDI